MIILMILASKIIILSGSAFHFVFVILLLFLRYNILSLKLSAFNVLQGLAESGLVQLIRVVIYYLFVIFRHTTSINFHKVNFCLLIFPPKKLVPAVQTCMRALLYAQRLLLLN